MMSTKTFKLALCSTNHNSFGLRHTVWVAEDGEAFEAHPSAFGSDPVLPEEVGKRTMEVRLDKDGNTVLPHRWEMMALIADAPQEVINILWP